MLEHSIRLLLHYLKFRDVPIPAWFIPLFSNAENLSAAQVVRIAQDAAKRAILDREELVIQEHLEASIQDVTASHG